jgi:hypothetical protein
MISFLPHRTYHSAILFFKPSLLLSTVAAGPLPACLSSILLELSLASYFDII